MIKEEQRCRCESCFKEKQDRLPLLGDYLEPYVFAINEAIENPEIRNLHIMQD